LNALIRRAAASDFVRNGALVLGTILFGSAFNYLYYVLMARALSVPDYGATLSLISGILVVLGLGTVGQMMTAKLAADLRAAGDVERMAAFSSAITRLSLWAAIAIALLAFGSQKLIAAYLHLDRAGLVIVAGVVTGVGFAVLLQRGLFQGFGAFPTFGISSALDGTKAIVLLPLTHLFGAVGSITAILVAMVSALTYGSVALRRRFGVRAVAARLDIRRMAVTAGATGLSSFGITALMFYDVVLARHFLDPIAAGLYGAVALAGRVLITIIAFLPTVLLPDVALRSATGRSDRHTLVGALAVAVVVIATVATVCGFFPQLILRVLAGAKFAAGASIVFPYVLAAGALALTNLLSVYAIARHRFAFVPYLMVVAICEVIAVTLRHASSWQIVQDVLVGHAATLCVMVVWLTRDLAKPRAAARS
jgi:O-antigen/teichoic acid export membrane protein